MNNEMQIDVNVLISVYNGRIIEKEDEILSLKTQLAISQQNIGKLKEEISEIEQELCKCKSNKDND